MPKMTVRLAQSRIPAVRRQRRRTGGLKCALLIPLALFMPAGAYAETAERGTRAQLHHWARCIAKSDKSTTREIVLGKEGALTRALKEGLFFQSKCAKGGKSVTFGGLSFLDPMAEYILDYDYRYTDQIVWSDETREVKETIGALLEDSRRDSSSQRTQRFLRELMGYCILERNHDGAVRLLQSDIDSGHERQLVQALASDVNACVDGDYPAGLTVDELRGAIATVRYRILYQAEHGDGDA